MTHPLFDLDGRVALVTGADLFLADLNLPGAEETAAEVCSLGRRALPVLCDVSRPEQVKSMFETLDAEFGRIDILGNVAGEGIMGPPEDMDVSVVMQVAHNLVFGRFVACREAGARMLARGKGSIINTGSIGGWNSLGRGHTAYGMAMASVIQMTRELSTEWSGRGVRVNAILPAQVLNAGLAERLASIPELSNVFVGGIPMGRLGRPEEIKGVAIFLASDAASFVSGAILPMDGGNLAMNAGGSYPGGPRVQG